MNRPELAKGHSTARPGSPRNKTHIKHLPANQLNMPFIPRAPKTGTRPRQYMCAT